MPALLGLDTNVLLRAVTGDDPQQSPAAQAFLEKAERKGHRVHLSLPVLCELVWALRGSRYRLDRPTIAAVLNNLLQTPLFEIQKRDAIRLALADYREGSADFPDYLIGRLDEMAGCEQTVTFDSALKGSDRFEILSPAP